jgi:hypothetical protein
MREKWADSLSVGRMPVLQSAWDAGEGRWGGVGASEFIPIVQKKDLDLPGRTAPQRVRVGVASFFSRSARVVGFRAGSTRFALSG